MPTTTHRPTATFERLAKRQTKLGVVGLGYVGLPLAVGFAKKFQVVGFDINSRRLDELRDGHDSTYEVTRENLSQVEIEFSSEPSLLSQCEVIVIAVPTPVTKQYQPDFGPLIASSTTVGQAMRPGTLVIYESTVYPGATEEWCVPTLEKASGKKAGKDFVVGYSPERINPGDRVNRLETIVKITSAQDPESAETVAQLYESILLNGVFRASSIKVAEAAKVFENTQRDVNIGLVNELAFLAHRLNIDTNEILAACKTKWNFLNFQPGLVGGHCISVDPYYLIAKGDELGTPVGIMQCARDANEWAPRFIAQEIVCKALQTGQVNGTVHVNILGFTYKENCPDTRNTKVAVLAQELERSGCKVAVADPLADPAEAKHEYGVDLKPLDQLERADVVVLAVPHRELLALTTSDLKKLCKHLVFDIKAQLDANQLTNAGLQVWRF